MCPDKAFSVPFSIPCCCRPRHASLNPGRAQCCGPATSSTASAVVPLHRSVTHSGCWLYRLYENARKVQEHLETERRNAEEHPVDPATGQPFFHPQVGRGPKHQRNEQNMPIGDYLHNFR